MIRFMAGHPTAANILMVAILVIGAISAPRLARETFPRILPSKVEITVVYPGARAEDVEQGICRRIEDAMDAVNRVQSLECEARESLARAIVERDQDADFERFTAEVKGEIDAIDDFPEQAETPIVRQLGLTDFVAAVAVTGPSNPVDMRAYAEELKARMRIFGGIAKVEIKGFSDHQIRISLKPEALRQFGLSAQDIAAEVARKSFDLPAGSLLTSDGDLLVRFADERRQARDYLDLVVVAGPQGGQIRLGEIATVEERFELDEERILFNGRRAVLLEISKAANSDTLDAIGAVNAFLEAERARTPRGIELTVTNDGSSIVRDRLDLLINNGWQGLLLVAAALWLVFGLRYSFWVAMGLPVSFAGTFFIMMLTGYSINMLTMVGMLIGIGLLMDDAIVLAENIASHSGRGKTPVQAAIDGTAEVLPSVTASFLTTAMIFGPLMFLSGDLGQLLSVIPAVLLSVLTVSLVEAFLILPNHLTHVLSRSKIGEGRTQRWSEAKLAGFRDGILARAVERAIRWRYATIGLAISLLLLAVAMPASGILKFQAFPELDGDILEARILLPQGTPLARTESVVARVVEALDAVNRDLTPDQPERQALVRNVTVAYNKNRDAFETGAHLATVTADLLSAEIRTATNDQIFTAWRDASGNLADVITIKFTEPAIGPAGLPIDMRLKGEDLLKLKAASLELQQWINGYVGVHDLSDDLRPGKPEFRVRLKDEATTLGLDGRVIADQLHAAFSGTVVNEIQKGAASIEIDVRFSEEGRNSVADLENFLIATRERELVPLISVATLERTRGYARINRVDGRPAVTIQGEVNTSIANAEGIVNDTLARFIPGLLERYPGIDLALDGQNQKGAETRNSMVRGFMIGLVGVFLLLSFQFRSYVEPIIVMIAIPLALIGVFAGHMIMGLDLSLPSILGFVALAGVVVNNSILLVNFIKMRHEQGETVATAATQASKARFRAVFLTSVTTLAGLLPILSETSLQAQVLIPLVTSLVFGLIASTVMVLFVVPAFYTVLDDLGLATLVADPGEALIAPAE